MQVVILAGGLATRLRPITQDIPKSMVMIKGKPFLEHQLALLKNQGIEHALILTGHLSEKIVAHFGDG